MHKLLLAVLLLAFSSTSAVAAEADEADAGVWIDVRSAREYRQGHIEGAINIPHSELSHRISSVVSDIYQPVHLYGDSSAYTSLALEILMEMGFEYVINEGSYEAVLARQSAP